MINIKAIDLRIFPECHQRKNHWWLPHRRVAKQLKGIYYRLHRPQTLARFSEQRIRGWKRGTLSWLSGKQLNAIAKVLKQKQIHNKLTSKQLQAMRKETQQPDWLQHASLIQLQNIFKAKQWKLLTSDWQCLSPAQRAGLIMITNGAIREHLYTHFTSTTEAKVNTVSHLFQFTDESDLPLLSETLGKLSQGEIEQVGRSLTDLEVIITYLNTASSPSLSLKSVTLLIDHRKSLSPEILDKLIHLILHDEILLNEAIKHDSDWVRDLWREKKNNFSTLPNVKWETLLTHYLNTEKALVDT
ncbi:MAG: hypothetical protein KDK65_04105, partial [Chlamydiia bacterium]|nr:hypothetical protein [Chlamydiia bacterium]